MFRAFGSEVTIVELLPTLLPLEDEDMGHALAARSPNGASTS